MSSKKTEIFDKDQISQEFWDLIVQVKDLKILSNLDAYFQDAIINYHNSRNRFEAKIYNLITIHGIVFALFSGFFAYVVQNKV